MPRRSKGPSSKASQGKPRAKAPGAAPVVAASAASAPPVAKDDRGTRLPQPPKEGSYYRSAVVFAGGVVVIAVLLFAMIREANVGKAPSTSPEVDDPLFEEVRHRDEFKDWVSKWRTADPYVSAAEFTLDGQGPIVPARPADGVAQPGAAELQPPQSERYVWSPDHSRYVDYLASFGEPDSTLDLYGRLDGRLETLAFCGTPCRFDGAFWLDVDRVAVFGRTEGVKQDGTPLCLPAGAAEEMRCYDRLTLSIYDLSKGTKTSYRSENHLFGADPYGPLKEQRWASGLSAEERATMGLGDGSEMETVRGEIIDIASEGRILTLGGGRVPRFLAVSEKASLRDESGAAMAFEALRKGFTVEARAIRQTDGTSLAASVRVVTAPRIIVESPADGATTGARIKVRGVARTFEGNVRLRVANVRSGKTLAEKFTTAAAKDAGAYGPFAFDLTLSSTSVKSGDPLTLELFDTSAQDGSVIDLVTLHLVYRP